MIRLSLKATSQSYTDWLAFIWMLFVYKLVKLIFQFIEIGYQQVEFIFNIMVRNAMADIRVPLCFMYVKLYFMFKIVDIDKLNVKLVMKMFYPQ